MSEAMTFSPGTQQGYPVFMPNQVLASEDLNALVTHFNQQAMLTRSQLIGWGMVHGLEVAVTSESIQVTAGVGLTAAGQMLALPRSDKEGGQPAAIAKTFEFAEASNLPQSSTTAPKQTIFELFEQDTEAKTRRPLTQLFLFDGVSQPPIAGGETSGGQGRLDLQSYVLMVVRDRQDILRPDSLLSYNATGQDRQYFLRFFLVPQALVSPLGGEAAPIAVQGKEPGSTPGTAPALAAATAPQTTLPPTLYRLGYCSEPKDSPAVVRLSTITHQTALIESYRRCCKPGIEALKQAIASLFEQISRLNEIAHLAIPVPAFAQKLPESDTPGRLQYFYSYLGTVLAAYGELADAVAEVAQDVPRSPQPPQLNQKALTFFETLTFATRTLGAAGSPSPLSYLLLGSLKPPAPGVERDRYRHAFTPAPVDRAVNQRRRHHIEFLTERLRRLCQADTFKVPDSHEIRVTPGGDRSVPLGQQAIPYYLNYQRLHSHWSYKGYQQGTGDRLPAYFAIKDAEVKPRTVGEHLVQVSPANTIYRIEGHLGQSCGTVLAALERYRQDYNLAFDVVCLRLADPKPDATAQNPNPESEHTESERTESEQTESAVTAESQTAGGQTIPAIATAALVADLPAPPHDFSQFARRHPGMEPIGGVVPGGTFVLVYVETGEKQDQIVADFALLGAIGSEALAAPPSCQIALNNPNRQDFSEADSDRYVVVLTPQYGSASGPGVIEQEPPFAFQPSQLRGQVADEQAVVITGRWGSHIKPLIVKVHAIPNPQFRFMGLESGPDSQGSYATVTLPPVDEPIRLEPVTSGGTFTCAPSASPEQVQTHLIQSFPAAFIAKDAQVGETYIIKYEIVADWGAPPVAVSSAIYVHIRPPTQTDAPKDAPDSALIEPTDQGDRPAENSDQSSQGLDQPINGNDLQASLHSLGAPAAALRPEEWQPQALTIPDAGRARPSAFLPVGGAIAPNALTEQTSTFLASLAGSKVPVDSEDQRLGEHRTAAVSESLSQPLIRQMPPPEPPPLPKTPQIGFWQRWRQSMSRHR